MKVIIAGSRGITELSTIDDAVKHASINIALVISGGARGVDLLGEQWANNNDIESVRYPADWDTYGKAAGFKRNKEMSLVADALIAIWDGESKGTKNMIDLMIKRRRPVFIWRV